MRALPWLLLLCTACQVEELEHVGVAEQEPDLTPLMGEALLVAIDDSDPHAPAAQDQRFVVGVWNLHKRTDGMAAEQLATLARDADVLAIQEALYETPLPEGFGGVHASSYRWSPLHAVHGVMTAGRVEPLDAQGLVTRTRELAVVTPKAALLTTHTFHGGEPVLVINVHALLTNVPEGGYASQLDGIVSAAMDHEGPVVWCGDFNTWSVERRRLVDDATARLGLSEVVLPEGVGTTLDIGGVLSRLIDADPTIVLDRIYVRGLEAVEVAWLPDLDASDHVPFRVAFRRASGR